MSQVTYMPRPGREADLQQRLAGALRNAWKRSERTQARIAADLDIQPKQLTRYFNAEYEPALSWIERFAEATNTTVQAILADAGIVEKLDLSAAIDADQELNDLSRDLLKSALATARRHGTRTTGLGLSRNPVKKR